MEQISRSREEDLSKRFSAEPRSNYELIRMDMQAYEEQRAPGDPRWKYLDDADLREKYVAATDKIIGIADGSISERVIEDKTSPEKSKKAPDTIIYLDKSARPVSWFVDAFWEQFAKESAKKPNTEFLNIDRTNWFMYLGHEREVSERYLGPKDWDVDLIDPEDIAKIRALFVEGELDEKNWKQQVWQMPTRLDGQNILVVDEVKNQGGTLVMATDLLKKAIPDATVSGDYFWSPTKIKVDLRNDDLRNDSVPVWYDSHNPFGRGIGDISIDYYSEMYRRDPSPENFKKTLGSFAISAPHHKAGTYELIEDNEALRLKQDIAFLTYSVADGTTLRRPNRHRQIEDWSEIIKNQGLEAKDMRFLMSGERKRTHRVPR